MHFLTSPEKTIEFWPEGFFFLQYLDGIQLPCLAGLSNQKSFFFFSFSAILCTISSFRVQMEYFTANADTFECNRIIALS